MELEILRTIQKIANPFLDVLFQIITMFGEDSLAIVVMAVIYWNYDKKFGEYIAYSALTSASINGMIKNIFKVKRPIGEEGIRSLRTETAGGYSFPSGHSQGAASFYGAVAVYLRKKWVSILCIITILAVGFSRMYLGVHWPKDVVGGILLGGACAYVTYKIYSKFENKQLVYWITFVILLSGITFARTADYFKALGAYLGFVLAMYIEKKYVNFSVEGNLCNKILRVVIGLAILLIMKSGLKILFPNQLIFHFIRYMCITFFGMGIYPMLFKKI